jgi:uncharacterized lipoprotein YmbA
MMVSLKRLGLALGILSLIGCAGPPAQHYTLSRIDAQSAASASVLPVAAKVKVGPYTLSDVGVPAESNNISLVVRQGDGRLMVLSDDRWTGSLSSQLSTAISQEMTQRVGRPPIQKLVAEAAGAGVTAIQLDVQRFDLIPGQSVALDAVWSMRFPGSQSFLTCYTRLQQPVGIGVLALVQGQQTNVQTLAAQLSEALVSRRAPAGSRCGS